MPAAAWRARGEGVPRFVERELRKFLSCGVMARGCARFRCDGIVLVFVVVFVGVDTSTATSTIHDKQGGCRWR